MVDGRDNAWRSRAPGPHAQAGCGRPEDRGVWTAKTVKRPPQQPRGTESTLHTGDNWGLWWESKTKIQSATGLRAVLADEREIYIDHIVSACAKARTPLRRA